VGRVALVPLPNPNPLVLFCRDNGCTEVRTGDPGRNAAVAERDMAWRAAAAAADDGAAGSGDGAGADVGVTGAAANGAVTLSSSCFVLSRGAGLGACCWPCRGANAGFIATAASCACDCGSACDCDCGGVEVEPDKKSASDDGSEEVAVAVAAQVAVKADEEDDEDELDVDVDVVADENDTDEDVAASFAVRSKSGRSSTGSRGAVFTVVSSVLTSSLVVEAVIGLDGAASVGAVLACVSVEVEVATLELGADDG